MNNWLETLSQETLCFYESAGPMEQHLMFQLFMSGFNDGINRGVEIGSGKHADQRYDETH